MRMAMLSLSAGLIFAQAEPHLARGIAMLREGHFEAASKELAAATRQPGATNQAFLNLGIAEAQLGRLGRAEAAFRRAIAMKPVESSAHYNLALVLLQKHEPSRAIRELETTVKLAACDRGRKDRAGGCASSPFGFCHCDDPKPDLAQASLDGLRWVARGNSLRRRVVAYATSVDALSRNPRGTDH